MVPVFDQLNVSPCEVVRNFGSHRDPPEFEDLIEKEQSE